MPAHEIFRSDKSVPDLEVGQSEEMHQCRIITGCRSRFNWDRARLPGAGNYSRALRRFQIESVIQGALPEWFMAIPG